MSTPTYPPARNRIPAWSATTAITAIARRPWMSRRTTCRHGRRPDVRPADDSRCVGPRVVRPVSEPASVPLGSRGPQCPVTELDAAERPAVRCEMRHRRGGEDAPDGTMTTPWSTASVSPAGRGILLRSGPQEEHMSIGLRHVAVGSVASAAVCLALTTPRRARPGRRPRRPAPAWTGFANNAQHTAVAPVTPQPLTSVHWHVKVDHDPGNIVARRSDRPLRVADGHRREHRGRADAVQRPEGLRPDRVRRRRRHQAVAVPHRLRRRRPRPSGGGRRRSRPPCATTPMPS